MSAKLKTRDAARAAGIHLNTLIRWMEKGKIRAPKPVLVGAVGMRLWSERDIERIRAHKAKYFRKGRGRKKKNKPR
jgi:predicted site-specific integrase-resolvase